MEGQTFSCFTSQFITTDMNLTVKGEGLPAFPFFNRFRNWTHLTGYHLLKFSYEKIEQAALQDLFYAFSYFQLLSSHSSSKLKITDSLLFKQLLYIFVVFLWEAHTNSGFRYCLQIQAPPLTGCKCQFHYLHNGDDKRPYFLDLYEN